MSIQIAPLQKSPVIVRAYGDRPVRLRAVCRCGGSVEVEGDKGISLAFPREYVFDCDDKLFEDLLAAYERHDDSALIELWAKAVQFDSRGLPEPA